MTTRDGETVKVASTLMEKKPTTNNGEEVTLLTDRDTGKALATETIAKALPTSKLSSEFDDETFDELDALKITNAKGTINFKVLGWARYVNEDSRCGTVVVLYTNPGSIQLDGVDMSFNEGVAGAFSRAGFQVTSRRRGRRSEDPDGQGGCSCRTWQDQTSTSRAVACVRRAEPYPSPLAKMPRTRVKN